jgi:hypothetical protein
MTHITPRHILFSLFFLIVFSLPALAAPPLIAQFVFQFYQDDAGLNAATQAVAEDTNYNPAVNTSFRLRIQTRSYGATSSFVRRLEFSEDSGVWTQITTNSNNVRLQASSNFSDGESTTSRISFPGTWSAGNGKSTSSDTASATLAALDGYIEDEYCLMFQTAAAGHTYQFRLTKAGALYTSYTVTPSSTPTGVVLPDLKARFGGGRIGAGRF